MSAPWAPRPSVAMTLRAHQVWTRPCNDMDSCLCLCSASVAPEASQRHCCSTTAQLHSRESTLRLMPALPAAKAAARGCDRRLEANMISEAAATPFRVAGSHLVPIFWLQQEVIQAGGGRADAPVRRFSQLRLILLLQLRARRCDGGISGAAGGGGGCGALQRSDSATWRTAEITSAHFGSHRACSRQQTELGCHSIIRSHARCLEEQRPPA